MTQGLPVIYTQNEGIDGYFKEGLVGYAVDPNDIGDIVNKIELIADNYEQTSKNAVQESQRFSWDQISNQYVKLYKYNVL
jgi:glycosyltransferase involved in cell wall biosynthesis